MSKRNTHKRKLYAAPKEGILTAKWIPYGYLYDQNTLLAIDEETADNVRFIFREYLSGKSVAEIAAALNEQGAVTPRVRRRQLGDLSRPGKEGPWIGAILSMMLINPIYAGDLILSGRIWDACYYYAGTPAPEDVILPEIQENHHEALISREDITAASRRFLAEREERQLQEESAADEGGDSADTEDFPEAPALIDRSDCLARHFSSLLYCGCCGQVMKRNRVTLSGGRAYIEFTCPGPASEDATPCPFFAYRQDEVAEFAELVIQSEHQQAQHFTDQYNKDGIPQQFKRMEANLRKELSKAVDELRRGQIVSLKKRGGTLTEGSSAISEAEQKVTDALEALRRFRRCVTSENLWLTLYSGLPENIDLLADAKMTRELVERIDLFPDRAPVVYLTAMEEKQKFMDALYSPARTGEKGRRKGGRKNGAE